MLVVFEGIDGCGKSAIAEGAIARLASRGIYVTSFATSVSAATSTGTRSGRAVVFAEAHFHAPEVLGYSSAALGLDSELGLGSRLTGPALVKVGPSAMPDLVVLVDIDPALARARRVTREPARSDADDQPHFELALGLQYRLRRGYLRLARAEPTRWAVVDNEGSLAVSIARVCDLIEHALDFGAPRALTAFRGGIAVNARLRADSIAKSPTAALEQVLTWVARRSVNEPAVAAYWLSGWHGAPVDDLRRSLSARAPNIVLAGTRGLTDDVSSLIRERLAFEHAEAVAHSVSGLSGKNSHVARLRAALVGRAGAAVASSLHGCDDESSWQLREQLFGAYPDQVTASLAQLGSDRAWRMRERWLSERGAQLRENEALSRVAARSVRGVPGERAWFVRIMSAKKARLAVLRSLAGLTDERSWQLREREIAELPIAVLETLDGVAHERAWRLRSAVAPACKQALDGIVGMSASEAWELRDEYRDLWPSTVVKSLGLLAASPRGQALVQRQLDVHGADSGVVRHAAAIALGVHREPSAVRVQRHRADRNFRASRKVTGL